MAANGLGSFIGELRHTLDSGTDLVLVQRRGERIVFGQDPLVVRKIARQFTREQEALADLKEQMIFVARKNRLAIRAVALGTVLFVGGLRIRCERGESRHRQNCQTRDGDHEENTSDRPAEWLLKHCRGLPQIV